MERYHILEPIGEGSFGRVFKGRRRFRGQVVAMKFIPKVGQSEKALHILEREIDIMRCLKHPNIVLLLDSFETKNEIVVVTEYAEGDLFQVLGDDGSLPENQVREIACQLVSALYYLHSHRILHRDMKPQNILLGKGGVVKLCDFGFARAMSASTLVLTSIKGTPLYMSPELVEEKPYDHLTDLWSLGCILYELHTGAPPFLANSLFQLVRLIVKAPIKWPESMSQDCLSFLSGLLMKNPEKRLSWPDLLYHPFVADGVDIVSGAGSSNPLTVPPSPDVQALKQQQAAEKTTARNGQSKLMLKAIKQREKAKTSRQEITSVSAAAASGGGAPPTAHSLGSTFSVYKNSAQTSTNQYPANDNGVTRTSSAPHKGQISTDYEREFPSVEVGPRQVLKQSGPSQNHLASARMEKEEDDFDYELPHFSQASVLQKLKMKLLTGQKLLSDRNSGGASAVLRRLRALRNISESSQQADIKTLAKEMDLPHLLFTLIEEAWKLPDSVQGEMLLEELLSVLIIFLEKSPDWQLQENRAENLCQLFISLFLSRDPRRSGLLATAVLTLFTQRGVSVNVSMERLTAFLANLLTDSAEIRNPLPAGWGMCDGLLSLMLYRLSERDSLDFESFKDSELWPCLWTHVKATLEKPDGERRLFSQNGLNVFLCLALLVFSNHPYNFLTLLSDVSPNCSFALSHLLIDTCRTSLSENGLFWEDSGIHSLSMKSCHLLCIPFSMELPLQKIQSVLQIYQKSNILANLVQMIQTLPVTLVELPLCLLNRLLLSDPFHITPRLITAAQDGAFIPRRTDSPTERNKTNGTAKNHSSSIKRPEPLKTPKSKGSSTKHPSKSKKPQRVMTGQQTHLKQPSGSVEELLDSLELQESLACYYRDLWDKRGNSLASPPDSLEIRGSGVDHQPVRTASALLAELLEGDVLSGSVTELFFLLSQLTHHLAGCSTFSLLVDVKQLREALRHQDDGVRAACCSFLGQVGAEVGSLQSESNPEPNWDPQLLQDLLRCLQDPAPCVRRRACKAAGSWLSKVRRAPFQSSEGMKVSSGRRVQAGEGHRDVWMLLAMAAAPSLVFLLSDVDNVIRQQCCGVLGVLALIRGVDGALLSAEVPKLLLHAACDDSHHAVRRAALGALCVFSQQNSLLMALRSLGAGRKLCHKYQSLLFQKDYQWLSRLDGSAEENL